MKTANTILAMMLVCLPFAAQAQSTELTCWTTKGLQTRLTVEETAIEIPNTIAAIDLRGVKAVTLDCSSANPNCLFYTDGTTDVEGLPSANVVCNGVCDGLLLTDLACFYCPMTFTATDAMLKLTPKWDDNGNEPTFSQPCHETVLLPFEADLVIPEDANGPMPKGWLQAAIYSGYDNDELTFRQADATLLNANTPYLVQFSYGAYGTQILFCGQNKTVEQTKPSSTNQESYIFIGTTTDQFDYPEKYRYHRGEEPYFIQTGFSQLMEPFRCFIVYGYAQQEGQPGGAQGEQGQQGEGGEHGSQGGENPSQNHILGYTIVDDFSTNITNTHQSSPQKCYDLSGRPVNGHRPGKGIYIIGNTKVVK